MSLIRYLSFICLIAFAVFSLQGQGNSPPVDNTFLALDLEEVGDGSATRLRQVGEFNEVLIEQSNQQAVLAQQVGNYNLIDVQIVGEANLIIAEQNGQNNNYELRYDGDDSYLRVGQFGDNNTLTQDFQNVRGLNISVQQTGNGNSLEMQESNFGPMITPLRIEQSGGMQLQISNLSPQNPN